MKVSGFSLIRNGLLYDYPFLEAIQSILPICDEFVVAVGDSSDGTREALLSLNEPKVKIIDTVWDDTLREGGRILAQQTDIALRAITGDWGFYIQGDEVLHERYLPAVKQAMEDYLQDPKVEGLLFDYKHFYGSYHHLGASRGWYRREIRVVRNNPRIHSWGDAQGFRLDGRKLHVKHIPASVYHYGWVRDPYAQQRKQETFHRYWHDEAWIAQNIPQADSYDYKLLQELLPFSGTHPEVMAKRIARMNWEFNYDPSLAKLSFKERASRLIEKVTGRRIAEYRNYKII